MKQDKFLTGILIGIGLLIVVAIVLFFTRQQKLDYVAESAPDSIVHNYVLAVLNKDYQKAYGYLADLDHKPTYGDFRQSFVNGSIYPDNVGLDIGTTDITGAEATVNLSTYYSNNDPFSSRSSSQDHASLVRQNGAWKLSYMPYNFWQYNWYQTP